MVGTESPENNRQWYIITPHRYGHLRANPQQLNDHDDRANLIQTSAKHDIYVSNTSPKNISRITDTFPFHLFAMSFMATPPLPLQRNHAWHCTNDKIEFCSKICCIVVGCLELWSTLVLGNGPAHISQVSLTQTPQTQTPTPPFQFLELVEFPKASRCLWVLGCLG